MWRDKLKRAKVLRNTGYAMAASVVLLHPPSGIWMVLVAACITPLAMDGSMRFRHAAWLVAATMLACCLALRIVFGDRLDCQLMLGYPLLMGSLSCFMAARRLRAQGCKALRRDLDEDQPRVLAEWYAEQRKRVSGTKSSRNRTDVPLLK